jgi:hypothetical protein
MRYMLALLCLLPGCKTAAEIEKYIPSVEVCFVYKGKEICAIKKEGVWLFKATLTPEEQAEIVKGIDTK